jgi:redox-sensitive bicupin YhaK (pirin superfamily)
MIMAFKGVPIYKLRKSKDRGHFDFGWLNTYHSFSFGEYVDRENMQFSCLRVINEDFIKAGVGFPTHGHRDMEIITYVISGALEHKDSLGNGTVINAGDVQRMTAGTGIKHSEFNHSKTEDVHLYQIWIIPNQTNLTPGYEQKNLGNVVALNSMKLVASQTGEQGSVTINQDVRIFIGKLKNQNLAYRLNPGRNVWVQVVSGQLSVDGHSLTTGDGLAVSQEKIVTLESATQSDFLFFDLP